MSDEREPTREDQAREDQAHRAKLEHMLASMLDDPAMASLMVERLLPRLTEEAAARHLPEHAARDWIFGRMRKLALDWRGGDEAVLETAGMPAEPPVPRPPADPLSETVVRDEAPAHPPFRPPVDAAADVPVGAPVDASADTGSPAPSATDSGESVRSDAEDADDSVARAGPPIGDVSAVAPAPATPPERPSPSDATWTMSAPIHASSGAAASTDAPPAAPPAPSTPEDGVTAERLTAGFSSLRSPERPPDQPKVAASGETAAPTAAATTPAGERPKDDPAGAPVGWPDGRKSLPPNWSPRRPVVAPPERKGFEGWFEVMMLVVAAAALVLVWQARLIDFGGSERKDAPPMASVSAPGDPPSATAPVSAAANV
ncbi:MAG: hypothetical protein KDE35_14525, partial [Geminicoccaceae bacterium]|nr:hypothetical protein [Geminicoccaceae bacterium]